jgi:hypothetical protein
MHPPLRIGLDLWLLHEGAVPALHDTVSCSSRHPLSLWRPDSGSIGVEADRYSATSKNFGAGLGPWSRTHLRSGFCCGKSTFITSNTAHNLQDVQCCVRSSQIATLVLRPSTTATMTTFTKITAHQTASIYTSPDQIIAEINPLIYGGFTEYFTFPTPEACKLTVTDTRDAAFMAVSMIPTTDMA